MQETRARSLGWEDPLEEEIDNTFQYSCLENPTDGGAWRANVRKELDTTYRLSNNNSVCNTSTQDRNWLRVFLGFLPWPHSTPDKTPVWFQEELFPVITFVPHTYGGTASLITETSLSGSSGQPSSCLSQPALQEAPPLQRLPGPGQALGSVTTHGDYNGHPAGQPPFGSCPEQLSWAYIFKMPLRDKNLPPREPRKRWPAMLWEVGARNPSSQLYNNCLSHHGGVAGAERRRFRMCVFSYKFASKW